MKCKKLTQKEKNILTYLEHGVSKEYLLSGLHNFFKYPIMDIKTIIQRLKKKKFIDEVKIPEIKKTFYIVSTKVPKSVLSVRIRNALRIN